MDTDHGYSRCGELPNYFHHSTYPRFPINWKPRVCAVMKVISLQEAKVTYAALMNTKLFFCKKCKKINLKFLRFTSFENR